MHFAYTQEQEDFRAGIRSLLDKHLPHPQLPDLIESTPTRSSPLWSDMATQLGLQGLQVPEAHGGSEYGPVELALVMEECGYALLPGPLFGTIALVVPLLLHSQDEDAQATYLPEIASGALAAAAATRSGDCHASERSGAWLLTGETPPVLGADEADVVVVIAGTEVGPSLFAVRSGDHGVRREVLETLDPTRRQAKLRFDGARAELVGERGGAAEILQKAVPQATAAQAAEQVGGAQRCLDIAVAYALERMQFGRAIGSFQAVKHRCAEVLMAVESARTAGWYAAWTLQHGNVDSATAVSVAKATASETYTFAARACIQVLGGIGYTWEHPAHLHLRRATSSEQLFGSPAEHFARLGDALVAGVRSAGLDGGADDAAGASPSQRTEGSPESITSGSV